MNNTPSHVNIPKIVLQDEDDTPYMSTIPEHATVDEIERSISANNVILTEVGTGQQDLHSLTPSQTTNPPDKVQEIIENGYTSKPNVSENASHFPDGAGSKGHKDRGSFGDIVLYNHQGHAYIDVNRLVYKPKPRKRKETVTEESIWYLPDFIFLLCTLITVFGSMYLFLVGATAIAWVTSVQSVTLDSTSKKAILHTGLTGTSPGTIGLILIVIGAINLVNVGIGTHAIVIGYRSVLVQHLVVDIALVAGQFTIAGIMSVSTARCDDEDTKFFEKEFKEFIRSYATPEPMTDDDEKKRKHRIKEIQLDNIQTALSCCGSSGSDDYLQPRTEEERKQNLDGSDLIFPSSCCRPWWVRNIYCAAEAHRWGPTGGDEKNPLKFDQRINPEGCLPKIKTICKRILNLMGPVIFLVGGIHSVLVCIKAISLFFHIRDIVKLVRAKNKQNAGKYYEASSSDSDDETDPVNIRHSESMNQMNKLAIQELKAHLPLPTEDQINLIKARSDFNTFEARVKRSHIGKWIAQARKEGTVHDIHRETSHPHHIFQNPPESNPPQVSVSPADTIVQNPESNHTVIQTIQTNEERSELLDTGADK